MLKFQTSSTDRYVFNAPYTVENFSDPRQGNHENVMGYLKKVRVVDLP